MVSAQSTAWAGQSDLVVPPDRRLPVALEDLETSCLLLNVGSEERRLRRMRGRESRQRECGIEHACKAPSDSLLLWITDLKLRTGTELTTRGTKAQEAQEPDREKSSYPFLFCASCAFCASSRLRAAADHA